MSEREKSTFFEQYTEDKIVFSEENSLSMKSFLLSCLVFQMDWYFGALYTLKMCLH